LYNDFDKLGIYFIWDGEVDYIENDSWHNIPSVYANTIINSNNHNDGIDIYLGNSLSPPAGQANGIGEVSSFIVAGFSGVEDEDDFTFWPQSSTISHEMGHVLFLWHTFHGTDDEGDEDPNECAECFEGIGPENSAWYCGDYIFDTPPDLEPEGGFYTGCNYIGGGFDVCGNAIDPLENNFMSYAPNDCRDTFTPGQKLRMKNAIAILPHLQDTQIQNYTYIRGNNLLCNFDDEFKIYSNDISNLTIEHSDNISINIGSIIGNQINLEVTNLDPNADEGSPAWIVAKISGEEVGIKNFWAGYPQKMNDNSIEGEIFINQNDIEEYLISERLEGATTYKWKFPGIPSYPPIERQPYELDTIPWQYDFKTKYHNKLNTMVGACEGELFIYGINVCGDGTVPLAGNGLEVNVSSTDPNCPGSDYPEIIYYPNPANSLLSVDLSLQEYKIFTLIVFDEFQSVIRQEQCTNVVETINTSSILNGTYYLHIYDGAELILDKILIINH